MKQDLSKSEYEIILINDGSTDGSEDIILQFTAVHENIIYLKQTNKGVSSARNLGLSIAKGNYVTFIDSDDTIIENTLGSIVEAAIKENLMKQLTAPVKWTQTMQQMIADGCTSVVEVGPGKVLQGLVKKVNSTIETISA